MHWCFLIVEFILYMMLQFENYTRNIYYNFLNFALFSSL
jgi:hypothetical protein